MSRRRTSKAQSRKMVESNANTAIASTPATNEDVLAAIKGQNSTVDIRFAEIKESFSSLKSALLDVCNRMSSTQAANDSRERCIEELERLREGLPSEVTQQQAKVDDLEAPSPLQNIRIVGMKSRKISDRKNV